MSIICCKATILSLPKVSVVTFNGLPENIHTIPHTDGFSEFRGRGGFFELEI